MLKLGKYEALNRQEMKSVFLDYVDAIEMPLIDYVAIGIQDTVNNTSTSMMSRDDWQKTFCELDLADHDPVRKASFGRRTKIFSLDTLDCQDRIGHEVMRQRKKHEIHNGIVLVKVNLGHNFIMTMGTGFKGFRPYDFYIKNYIPISKVFRDLVSLIAPVTKKYQRKIINHPDRLFDAK